MDRLRQLALLLKDRRGNSVIEFALLLPILLLVVFGITEFGRAWMNVNVLATAAREGARLAVVTDPDVAAVQARVTEVLTAARITPTSISVAGPDDADPQQRVTITVTSDFVVIPGSILGTFNGTIPLRSTVTMRHESF
jgi:Flp pilus assembly protein TadG